MKSQKNIHFHLSERKILLRVFDVLFVLFGLFIIGEWFDFDYFKISAEKWVWVFILSFYLLFFGSVLELYNIFKASKFDASLKGIVITTTLTVVFFLLTPFYTPTLPENRLQIIYFYLAVLFSLLLWRYAYSYFISSPLFIKRVLLIAESKNLNNVFEFLKDTDPNYHIIAYMPKGKKNADISNIIRIDDLNENIVKELQVSEILITNGGSKKLDKKTYNQLIQLRERGIAIKNYEQVYEELTNKLLAQHFDKDFNKYFPFTNNSTDTRLYAVFHRLIDIIFSIFGLIILLILLPFILIGNLLGNQGPLFYTQERVGRNGELFNIYKLRSMVVNAEKDGAVWAKENDTRITKFGRFLRRSRIDELPQFFNVLSGSMSTIGPRPERPIFVEQLSREIPFYQTRHTVKPGLTGWAQVNSHYGASVEDSLEKLQYDLYYIKHRGMFLDITIIKKTLSTVIFFRGR